MTHLFDLTTVSLEERISVSLSIHTRASRRTTTKLTRKDHQNFDGDGDGDGDMMYINI